MWIWSSGLFLCCFLFSLHGVDGIVGGVQTSSQTDLISKGMQWICGLFNADNGSFLGVASIISSRHLLTACSPLIDVTTSSAASYITRNAMASCGTYTFGNSNVGSGTQTNERYNFYIEEVVPHPDFTVDNYQNHPSQLADLCVLKTSRTMQFGEGHIIDPVAIVSEYSLNRAGKGALKVAGFADCSSASQCSPDTVKPNVLKQYTILDSDQVSTTSCMWTPAQYYYNNLPYVADTDPHKHLCSLRPSGGNGPCYGDAGAPLFDYSGETQKQEPYLIGIWPGIPNGFPYNGNCAQHFVGGEVPGFDQNYLYALKNYNKYISLIHYGPWVQKVTGTLLPYAYPSTLIIETDPPTPLPTPQLEPLCKPRGGFGGAINYDACGGESPSRTCWCDKQCQKHGDCCSDFITSCSKIYEEYYGDLAAGDGCSAAGACGQQSGACWCDYDCEKHGDCCENYKFYCSDLSSTDTCAGYCGGKAVNCWCDEDCGLTGDCCSDYYICSQKSEGDGSCKDRCGQKSGTCWCDAACEKQGDCCPNFETRCGLPGSCEGYCGHKSGEACWCDSECMMTGDCCYNFNTECSAYALTAAEQALLFSEGG